MTTKSPKIILIERAALLARSSPQLWADFLAALNLYNDVQVSNLVRSPLNELPINQGRVQTLLDLYGILAGSPESADKINKR